MAVWPRWPERPSHSAERQENNKIVSSRPGSDPGWLPLAITEEVRLRFMRDDFAGALFGAMRRVEPAHGGPSFRKATMGSAYDPTGPPQGRGPLREPGQEEAEREALIPLCRCGRFLQNPHSHSSVPMEDTDEAMEVVMIASHLLRMLDAQRAAPQERQTDAG